LSDVPAQREHLTLWAQEQKINIRQWFVDNNVSAGKAAEKVGRQGYLDLVEAIKEDKVRTVLVVEPSRVAREWGDGGLFLRLMAEKRVHVVVVSAHREVRVYDADQFADHVYTSTRYSREQTERMTNWRARKDRAGEHAAGNPYGWVREPIIVDRQIKTRWTHHPEQYAICRRIVDELLGGSTPGQVANALNVDGIPGPGSEHHKRDVQWTSRTVRQMVSMPRWAGWYGRPIDSKRYIDYEMVRPSDEFPPIYRDMDERDAVMAILEKGRRRVGYSPKSHRLLSGMVRCARCEAKLISEGSGGSRTYVIRHAGRSNARRTNGTPCTGPLSIDGQDVEDLVTIEVAAYIARRGWEQTSQGEDTAKLETQLQEALSRRAALVAEIAANPKRASLLYAAADTVDDEIADLERRAEAARKTVRHIDGTDAARKWASDDIDERRSVLADLVDCVTIEPGPMVRRNGMVWERLPFDPERVQVRYHGWRDER